MTQIVETTRAHLSDQAEAARAWFSTGDGATFNTRPGGSDGATQ